MYIRPSQIILPSPLLAATSSAATMVTNELAIASRMPVRMYGTVAGRATKKKICGRARAERARGADLVGRDGGHAGRGVEDDDEDRGVDDQEDLRALADAEPDHGHRDHARSPG